MNSDSSSAAHDAAPLPWRIVWALSVTQVVAWGSIYYAISVLMAPIEQTLGWSRDSIVGAFSLSLLIAGLAAFPVGAMIDKFGGRSIMAIGSCASGVLLLLLSQVQSIAAFYLIWMGLGLCMAAVLYEPAFTVITASFGASARKGITALTLAGGLASTFFWPLTQMLVTEFGWRHTLIALALFNLLICVPLHAFVLPGGVTRTASPELEPKPPVSLISEVIMTRTFWMLATAFTFNMLAFSALSVHLIPLLMEKDFAPSTAVWLAALVGPMQVAGRVCEYTVGSRFKATQIAMAALSVLPFAMIALVFASSTNSLLVLAFVVLYGASNGIMTIARGAIPVELYGRERYGAINGALAAPVLASRAAGPIVASLIWSASGGYDAVLWTIAAFGVLSVLAFSLHK